MTTEKKRVLTGIKPTGVPHLGNYLGAMRPSIQLMERYDGFLFIPDLHALTVKQDPERLREMTYTVAASWLAFGLDPEHVVFYRQSDIPEVTMLTWLLDCVTPMGLLNRAHSVKDARARGAGDDDVNVGLFSYPVLMAADILLFDTDLVPVGKDQKQHLEIAQEAARKFNNAYGDVLKVPDALIDERVMTIPGLDGRKMSKSYDNTIDPFLPEKQLKKRVNRIVTDTRELGDPLETSGETVFHLYELLADTERTERLRRQYETGRRDPTRSDDDFANPSENYFGWGNAKSALFSLLMEHFAEARSTYARVIDDRAELDRVLLKGADRARETATVVLDRAMRATGLRPAAPR